MGHSKRIAVDIVGGGIAGLTVAYFLAQYPQFDLTLYEAKAQLGGLITTVKHPWGIAEWGAAGWLNSAFMEDFIAELGLPVEPYNPHNKKKFIFRQRLSKWPLTFSESLEFINHLFIKNHLSRRKLMPKEQETIAQWGDRALGPKANFYILQTALRGVYVGKGEELNAQMILGRHFKSEKKAKPIRRGTVVPQGGMISFIQHLQKQLTTLGVKLKLNTSFTPELLSSKRITIFTIPLNRLAPFLPELTSALSSIHYDDLTTVTTFSPASAPIPRGFGGLFTPDTPSHSLGAIFSDGLFQHQGPFRAVRWIFRGVIEHSSAEIKQMIKEDFHRLTGHSLEILGLDYQTIPAALPRYDNQLATLYYNKLQHYNTPHSNLYLHGNYMEGIGLTQIVERSYELAQLIKGKS